MMAQTVYSSMSLVEKFLIPELASTARDKAVKQVIPFCMGELASIVCSLADGMSVLIVKYPTEEDPTFITVQPRGDAGAVNLNVVRRWKKLEASFDQST